MKAKASHFGRAPRVPFRALLGASIFLAALFLGATFASAVSPVVTIEPAENVTYTSAQVKGTVNPEDHETSYHFEYATQAQFEACEWCEAAQVGFGNLAEGAGPTTVQETLSGLQPGTTYHLRLVASNESGGDEESAPNLETLAVAPPVVTINDADQVTATSAHFSGTVEVESADEAFNAECRFDYVKQAAYEAEGFASAQSVNCTPNVVHGPGSSAVEAEAQLDPNATYHVRISATNRGGTATEEAEHSFTTAAAPPGVETLPAGPASETAAFLGGRVNPNFSATTYWVEYGPQDCESGPCTSIPASQDASAGEGGEAELVIQHVTGLEPGTTYHYRLVAQNQAGTSYGEDVSFTTLAVAGPPDPCPNQELRTGASARLSECRAYEMVTPADKGGSSPWFNPRAGISGGTTVSTRDGERLLWFALLPIPGSPTGQFSSFIATHGPDGGWTNEAVSPPTVSPFPRQGFGFSFDALFSDATPDLKHMFTTTGDSLAPDDRDDPIWPANDVYERQPSGSYLHVSSLGAGFEPPRMSYLQDFTDYQGSSTDARHVLFVTNRPYAPAVETEQLDGVSLYDRHEGHLDLVGIDDSGHLTSPCGSQLGGRLSEQHAVSDDGSHVYFTSPEQIGRSNLGEWSPGDPSCKEPTRIYLRLDDSTTVEISRSRRPSPDPEGFRGANFVGASRDGSKAFFTSPTMLTNDAGPVGSAMLYEYDAAADHLRFLAPGIQGPADVLAVSSDGEYVYFLSNSILDHGRGTEGQDNLYVAHAAAVRYIATLGGAFDSGRMLTDVLTRSPLVNLTPDGRFFLFLSNRNLTSYDSHGEDEAYRYDAMADRIICVSCNPSGAAPIGGASLIGYVPTPGAPIAQKLLAHNLSDDGSRVFFQTQDQLVPADVNRPSNIYEPGAPGNSFAGGTDVYEWHDGRLSLISSGRGTDDSWFVDSSADGRDAFLATSDSLSARDVDNGDVDIYDVRRGGGEPPQPPASPSCAGEACQSSEAPAPADDALGSSALSGGAHRAQRRHHRHRRHRHRRHHRTATTDRGGRR